jgi:glyoxalase family protein
MNAQELILPGIHHVTAIASDPQRNLDFYTQVLGLRLVKLTVNFDDPGTYHFYLADETGTPGTVLTFFPWPNARQGRVGSGQIAVMAFAIPHGSREYWKERLAENGVTVSAFPQRFGDSGLAFQDPDGLQLELVESDSPQEYAGWTGGPVEPAYALRGFHSVTLWLQDADPSRRMLEQNLGFRYIDQDGDRLRFEAPGAFARVIDLVALPDMQAGKMGAGVFHHVAWRAHDDNHQLAWRDALLSAGVQVTPVRDRQYFHSIYFYEPGGVLFEIATDPPGFTLDESPEQLGSALRLPSWYEPQREQIELALPRIMLPTGAAAPR